MLRVIDIHTYYGDSCALWGISLEVREAAVVSLLGRNGMGKTTTIRSIMGLTPPRRGQVYFKGKEIQGIEPYQIARMGLSLVPQGRAIFPSLSVKENLTMAARDRGKDEAWTLERIYSLFPILKARAKLYANLLSGGEQQMLSISRALMTNPDLLLMDEPSEGLAPMILREISVVIDRLGETIPVLLAEQNYSMALGLADYVYLISKGTVVYESTPGELRNNEEVKSKHLGV